MIMQEAWRKWMIDVGMFFVYVDRIIGNEFVLFDTDRDIWKLVF